MATDYCEQPKIQHDTSPPTQFLSLNRVMMSILYIKPIPEVLRCRLVSYVELVALLRCW